LHRSSHYELGLLYEQGLGVPRDPIAAIELYQTIARTNRMSFGATGDRPRLLKAEIGMAISRVDDLQ
jgi:TPR repeat protein